MALRRVVWRNWGEGRARCGVFGRFGRDLCRIIPQLSIIKCSGLRPFVLRASVHASARRPQSVRPSVFAVHTAKNGHKTTRPKIQVIEFSSI